MSVLALKGTSVASGEAAEGAFGVQTDRTQSGPGQTDQGGPGLPNRTGPGLPNQTTSVFQLLVDQVSRSAAGPDNPVRDTRSRFRRTGPPRSPSGAGVRRLESRRRAAHKRP